MVYKRRFLIPACDLQCNLGAEPFLCAALLVCEASVSLISLRKGLTSARHLFFCTCSFELLTALSTLSSLFRLSSCPRRILGSLSSAMNGTQIYEASRFGPESTSGSTF